MVKEVDDDFSQSGAVSRGQETKPSGGLTQLAQQKKAVSCLMLDGQTGVRITDKDLNVTEMLCLWKPISTI